MNRPRLEQQIAAQLQLDPAQVSTVLQLHGEGATVPFLARYRKEQTGGMDEEQLRALLELHSRIRALEERRETILAALDKNGLLSTELQQQLHNAATLTELEDLYLPYRPKRRTRASAARDAGLAPLAELLLQRPAADFVPHKEAQQLCNPEHGFATAQAVLDGALDIIAEQISETAAVRQTVRSFLHSHGKLQSVKATRSKPAKNAKDVYQTYHKFSAPLKSLKPYQVLALNRGEKEKFLTVSVCCDSEQLHHRISSAFFSRKFTALNPLLQQALADGTARLLLPSIERELRRELTEHADRHAINIFAANLQQLLLQPPVRGQVILGIDPGFVSGCKVAVIDATGNWLEGTTIYPHPPQKQREAAYRTLLDLIRRHNVSLLVIGNGTAGRETEQLAAELVQQDAPGCRWLITSEAGASVYSASPAAKEEFPDLEAAQRGNISIARRVLDPLAELVKIDPKALGVGLYQHDVDQKELQTTLDTVTESCVNRVGVNLNTASVPLLTRVSGLGQKAAREIIAYRTAHGPFNTRKELRNVPGIGPKAYQQAAGFLRLPDGSNPLDRTAIHPESYPAARKLLNRFGLSPQQTGKLPAAVLEEMQRAAGEPLAAELGIGLPTLRDIIADLLKPDRDPRDDRDAPLLRSDILKLEDLREGMELEGTVRNVVDFGAFVDIGVKQDGLIHISNMPGGYNSHPLEIVQLGRTVRVRIVSLDAQKGRIGLQLL